MKKIISTISILLAFSLISYADFETGNSLYEQLINYKGDTLDSVNVAKYFGAWGYVIGVYDTFSDDAFEAPLTITRGQVLDIAIKYLKNHPELRHLSVSTLLFHAFVEAFPKKKEEDKKGRGNEPYTKDNCRNLFAPNGAYHF